ncbi:MAG: MotA/TolQ/ExbB proton channel family protein [Pseudomonadota bacterium]
MTDAVAQAPSDPNAEDAPVGAPAEGPLAAEGDLPEGSDLVGGDVPADVLADAPADGLPNEAGQALSALLDAADLVAAGGPVVVLLLVLSVLALAIVLAKLWQFAASGVRDGRNARAALALYRDGRVAEALQRARASRSPASEVLALAIREQVRGVREAKIREECFRAASERLEALRSWMRPLEVIASLAPLLGLFGTVLGMIEAFSQLEAAGSQVDPAILSGGIWEALLTTAVGLAVAIPVVAAVNWFERRIERQEHVIDTSLAGFFATDWSTAADTPASRLDAEERSANHDRPQLQRATVG